MQKRVKMVVRISGVVIWPRMEERWWMVWRRSMAMRSPVWLVFRPWITWAIDAEAFFRAWWCLAFVIRMLPAWAPDSWAAI